MKYEVERQRLTNVECNTVAVVLDRQQGAEETAAQHGVTLTSLIPFRTLGLPLLKEVMHPAEWDVLTRYLADPDQFQTGEAQAEVRDLAGRL